MKMNIAVYVSLYINATAIEFIILIEKKKKPTKAKGPRVPESCNVDLIFGCDKQGCGATGI